MYKFADKIWIAEQPLKFFGLELGARMTIVNISDNELLVHSPIRPTDELVHEINRLGTVKYIVAPNLFHHLYVDAFKEKYPNAKLYCAPGLAAKRPGIKFDEVIEENKRYPWSHIAEHHIVQGSPFFNETVFFLPLYRTLLVTDLGVHVCEDSPPLTRFVFKVMGMFKKFGWSKIERWLFVRNNKLFRASTKKILSWDFDKIILSHGQLVKRNGHNLFKKAFG